MIFNCPECSAGHSVPVSMIPNGGLDMDCRRCGEAFTIEPPAEGDTEEEISDDLRPALDAQELDTAETPSEGDTGEKTSVGPPPMLVESTRVGVANPLDFEDSQPLIGPGGIEYDAKGHGPRADTERKKSYQDPPTAPFPKDHVPLSAEEDDLDPELDNTVRFDQAEEGGGPFAAPSVTEPGVPEHAELSDVAPIPGLDGPPSNSDSSPSVYERVAAGIPVPEEQRAMRVASLPPRTPSGRPRSIFQPAIDLLNGAPLALKVGLIVFPVTLGVMLVVNSMSQEEAAADAPIEIPVAAEAVVPAKQEDPPPMERAAAEEEAKAEVAAARPAPAIDDAPAPAGFAYVQIEDARLRVRPGDKSGIAGRVQIGALVKVYDELGEFSLVASLPEGPAGFLSNKLLGPRKPLALLARDQSFEKCSAQEGYTVDDCLFSAKGQEQSCLDRCGAVNAGNDAERLRCAEVCNIAFDDCARSCRQSGPRIAKGKRRRR
jgi:hypothetical protein